MKPTTNLRRPLQKNDQQKTTHIPWVAVLLGLLLFLLPQQLHAQCLADAGSIDTGNSVLSACQSSGVDILIAVTGQQTAADYDTTVVLTLNGSIIGKAPVGTAIPSSELPPGLLSIHVINTLDTSPAGATVAAMAVGDSYNAPSTNCSDITSLLFQLNLSDTSCCAGMQVQNNNDRGIGSLRCVLSSANDSDTVTFAPALDGATIQLDTPLYVSDQITLDASALLNGIIIDGGGNGDLVFDPGETRCLVIGSRPFPWPNNSAGTGGSWEAHVKNVTIQNGFHPDKGANVLIPENQDQGANTVTFTDCVFQGGGCSNTAVSVNGRGAGLYNTDGFLTFNTCRFSDNTTYDGGSAMWSEGSGTLDFSDCTFENNEAVNPFGIGGAVTLQGSTVADFDGCSFFNNHVAAGTSFGGAVFLFSGTISRHINCTFNANSAGRKGGAIYSSGGAFELTHCTIVGNEAGLEGDGVDGFGTIQVQGSIIRDNGLAGAAPVEDIRWDVTSDITSLGHNMVGTGTGILAFNQTGDIVGTGFLGLAPFANYGGEVGTMPPELTSPALNTANAASAPTLDARGAPRVGVPDKGAAEQQLILTWPLISGSIVYGTSLGAAELNATANLGGSFAYTPAAGTLINAGTCQPLSTTFTPDGTGLFASSTTPVTLNNCVTVTPAPTVLSLAPATISYGDTLSAVLASLVVTGPPAAGATFSISGLAGATTATVLDAGSYTITINHPGDANHNATAPISQSITVVPTPLTITANNASKQQGDPNPTFSASFSGFVNSDTAASLSPGVSFSTTATTSSPIGTYPITPSAAANPNYTITFVDGILSVGGQNITVINWPAPGNIVFSALLTGTQLSATASFNGSNVSGTFVYTPPAGSQLGAGFGQTLNVSFTPTDTANFTGANGTTTINVLKAPTTMVPPANTSIVYGSPLSTLFNTVSFAGPNSGSLSFDIPGATPELPTSVLDVGTYSLTVTHPGDANHNPGLATFNFIVTPAALTITADNLSKQQGASNPPLTASFSGFVNGDNAASLSPGVSLSTSATTTSPVGTYPITASGAVNPNYSISHVNGSLTVGGQNQTVFNWPTPNAIVYGTVLGAAQLNATATFNGAAVPGVFTYTPAAGSVLNAGLGQTLNVSFTPTDSVNFTAASGSVILDVSPASLTITANSASKQQGDPNPSLSAQFAGFVNGDTAASLSPAVSLSTTATTTSPIGTYPITPSNAANPNYAITFVNGTLSVGGQNQTVISWSAPTPITFGTALSGTQLNATATFNGSTVPGSFTYTPSAGTQLDAGFGQTLNVAFSPNDPASFTAGNVSTSITVLKAPTTIVPPAFNTIVYGSPLSTLFNAFTVNGPSGGLFQFDSAGATPELPTSVLDVGSYTLTVGHTGDSNHDPESNTTFVFSLTPAPLTVTANNATKQQGDPNPIFSAQFAGFVNGDTAASLSPGVSLSTTATTTSPVGTYPITASGAVNPNYAITFVNGTLSVGGQNLTVLSWSAPSATVYGTALGAAQLNATATFNGAAVPGTFSYTPAAGTILNAGLAQPLNVTFTPTDLSTFAAVSGSVGINVTPAPLTITPNDETRLIGLTNPGFTATYSGFVNGDTEASLSPAVSLSSLATPASAPGPYSISSAGAANPNYDITFGFGILTVSPRSVPVIFWGVLAPIVHLEPLDASRLNAEAMHNGAVVPGTYTYTPALGDIMPGAGAGQPVTVNFTPDDTVNFDPATRTRTIDVGKAEITFNWSQPANMVLGSLTTNQLNATANAAGPLSYSPALGDFLFEGTQTLTVSHPGNANFNPGSFSVSIVVLGCSPPVFSPLSAVVPASGGTHTFTVFPTPDCLWFATGSPASAFLSISPTTGTVSRTITYEVAPNTGVERTLSINLGGTASNVIFEITQLEGCDNMSFTFASTSLPADRAHLPIETGPWPLLVSAPANCNWVVDGSVPWVSSVPGGGGFTATGTGSTLATAPLVFYQEANLTGADRSGHFTLNGNVAHTFTQPFCTSSFSPASDISVPKFMITPSNATEPVTGSITLNPGCEVVLGSSESWIQIDNTNTSFSASGVVNYSIVQNVGEARSGTLFARYIGTTNIAASVTIHQATACDVAPAFPEASFVPELDALFPGTLGYLAAPQGGFIELRVQRPVGTCRYDLTTTSPFVDTGVTNRIDLFPSIFVEPGIGVPRVAEVFADGTMVRIYQPDNCGDVSVSASTISPDQSGGLQTINITVAFPECSWEIIGAPPWVSFPSHPGGSGTGSATLEIQVAPNPSGRRDETFTIGGQSFTISQGSLCGGGGTETTTIADLITGGFTGPAFYNVTGIDGFNQFMLNSFSDLDGPCLAKGGQLQVYGFTLFVSKATVVNNTHLSVQCRLGLPDIFVELALGTTSPEFFMDFFPDGSSAIVGTEITLPEIQIPASSPVLTLRDLTATIDTSAQRFGGGGLIGIGAGPGGGLCLLPPGPKLFGGSIFFQEGQLDQITFQADNLGIPLGSTPVNLEAIGGGLYNLTSKNNWRIGANLGISAGCPVRVGTIDVTPLYVDAMGSVYGTGAVSLEGYMEVFGFQVADASASYNPKYNFKAALNVNLLEIFFAKFAISISSTSFSGNASGELRIPAFVPIVGGMTLANASAYVNNYGLGGEIGVRVGDIPSVNIPQHCVGGGCRRIFRKNVCFPEICTPEVDFPGWEGAEFKVGFDYTFADDEFVFNKAAAKTEPWEVPFQTVIRGDKNGAPGYLVFMKNYSRSDKVSTGKAGRAFGVDKSRRFGKDKALVSLADFNVPAGEDTAIFRISWEGPANAIPPMALVDPAGTVHNIVDGLLPGGFPGIPGAFGRLPLVDQNREASFVVTQPATGNYDILVDSVGLSNVAVEYLRENLRPAAAVHAVTQGAGDNNITVNYTTDIREGIPTTEFYLTRANADFTDTVGPRFDAGVFTSANGTFDYTLPTDLEVPPGTYNIAVVVEDPDSLRTEAISEQLVYYGNADSPTAPENIQTRSGNGSITVGWEGSPEPNVVGYIIYYRPDAEGTENDERFESVAEDTRLTTINGLRNGQPDLLRVVAVNDEQTPSPSSRTVRVVPTIGFGLTPPCIVSQPDIDATAGQQYFFQFQTCDADDGRTAIPASGAIEDAPAGFVYDGEGLRWELITGPAGMIMQPSGRVEFTPTDAQVGNHPVVVRATDAAADLPDAPETRLYDEKSYTLIVVPSDNLSALETARGVFVSRPVLDAYEDETFSYTPQFVAEGSWAFQLVQAPDGMVVNPDGSITWDVPTGAEGMEIRLKAVQTGPGADPTACVIHRWFLNVNLSTSSLPEDLAFSLLTRDLTSTTLVWPGKSNGASYQVQSTTDLINGPWVNEGPTKAAESTNAHLDAGASTTIKFYRVIETP